MIKQQFAYKLLVINFGGIGDEILFLPTLEAIRRTYPHWKITLLLEPRSLSVSEVTDIIDDTITFDIKKRPLCVRDLLELLTTIRNGGFDIVISSGSSKLVSILLFLSGIPVRIGYHAGKLSEYLLTTTVPLNKNQYAACMYHDLVKCLDVVEVPLQPHISVSAPELAQMRQALPKTRAQTVLIHPGTSKLAIQKGLVKTWPVQNWAELIDRLAATGTVQVIVTGGPDDKDTIASILELVDSKSYPSVFVATKSLAQLAALIKLSDLVVCVDSAPMHLAVALNRPLVALFEPTNERLLLPASKLFMPLRAEGTKPLASLTAADLAAGTHGVTVEVSTAYTTILEHLKRGQIYMTRN